MKISLCPLTTGLIALTFNVILSAHGATARDATTADVIVYGGTPGGVMAAIAAARDGASVVLLEQTRHVGGMSTSGLNRDEGEHMDRSTFGGLSERFTKEAARRSGTGTENAEGARIWKSRIAEQVFLEMLKEAGVPVRYGQLLDKAQKTGTQITRLQVRGGDVFEGKVFIDATYEGDLMAAAGVSYAVGREARDTYQETKAGVRYMDEKVWVSPYDGEGKLLFGVMPGKPPVEFAASEHPICYNVRPVLTTDPQNSVPIEKPANYDPKQQELLARCIEAGYLNSLQPILSMMAIPGTPEVELNNTQFGFVSMSIPGAQTAWAEASFEDREKIHQQYRDYTHGMFWFLKSDERVPKAMREDMSRYGFRKDEWEDNGHWPWYLYIRAARRMKGAFILTQADATDNRKKEDVIHIASHYIDSHQVARYAVDESHFINEGRMWQAGRRFDIPYRAITPRAEECGNLLVPVCVSASNVAFAAIRLEPTWMHLGEVSGMAAAQAVAARQQVQEIDVAKLQARIAKAGIPLEWTETVKPATSGGRRSQFGTLVFEDQFERVASPDSTEPLGNAWVTEGGSSGRKQAELRDGTLFIQTAPDARQPALVKHAFQFKDGTIELKVKFSDKSDSLRINLCDYDEKSSGANIADVVLKPAGIRLEDLKTGQGNLNIQAMRRKNALSAEQAKELLHKRKEIAEPLSLEEWHQIRVNVVGDTISCSIDGKNAGSLQSPGISHETKTWLRFIVPRSVCLDDVKLWCIIH